MQRLEEAEREIGEGKRREMALADELKRKDEEISKMRENAVEREKVMREVEIAVQKERMVQVRPQHLKNVGVVSPWH